MPDVSKLDIGRRLFQLNKERSAEAAAERIRKRLGSDWTSFSQEDVEIFKRMLGEAWVYIDRRTWDQIQFTLLSKVDINRIISIGRDLEEKKAIGGEEIGSIIKILEQFK
jgi:hypothetical protein